MFKVVALIGVGFMGGSLALALKNKSLCERIVGFDISDRSLEEALRLDIIDEGYKDLINIGRLNPELVVIASPVGTFIDIARVIKSELKDMPVVTDLGSVKGELVYEMESIIGNTFVGGHPIAGTEKSGVVYSLKDLFFNKKIILTPTDRTDKESLMIVENMWKSIGAKVETMDPYVHDYVFGAVSHLPHAVAFSLIEAIDKLSVNVDLFQYPGAGFKDFTRIAASNPVMWRDIFLANKDNVIKAIDTYISSLERLRDLIEREEGELLLSYIEKIRDKRLSIDET